MYFLICSFTIFNSLFIFWSNYAIIILWLSECLIILKRIRIREEQILKCWGLVSLVDTSSLSWSPPPLPTVHPANKHKQAQQYHRVDSYADISFNNLVLIIFHHPHWIHLYAGDWHLLLIIKVQNINHVGLLNLIYLQSR